MQVSTGQLIFEGEWGPSGRCGAINAIVIYPIGLWLLNLRLLLLARQAIVTGKKTPLSKGISFLYKEYGVGSYCWELMEMLRKLILVGFAVVYQPGSILQIVTGTIVCAIYLLLQMQARPYANSSDVLTNS